MRVIALLLLVGLSVPTVFSQGVDESVKGTPQATTRARDELKLRELESELLKAENENDANVFSKILGTDFRTVTPDGRVLDRSDVVEDARHRSTMHLPYRVDHSHLQLFQFGDSAVVTYLKEYVGTEGEAKGKVRKQAFLDVFSKDGSQWKLRFTKAEAEASEE